MTERVFDRMVAGKAYMPDTECAEIYRRGVTLCARYNELYVRGDSARGKVLEELFGFLGDSVEIRPTLQVDYGINTSIGSGCFFNFNTVILDVAPVTIGDAVLVGSNVQFLTPTHPLNPHDRRDGWEGGLPITVEDNVWIGSGAIILPGVTIGKNAVVGAGAVVSRDVPHHAVVAGNPARVIKTVGADERPQTGQFSAAALGLATG